MSKSRGTFITARSYLEQKLNPEWLRYYFAGKSNGTMEDVDLNLDDMIAKVNSDLVGKFVNIASRCAGFIAKRFDGKLAEHDPPPPSTGTSTKSAPLKAATSAAPCARSWSSPTRPTATSMTTSPGSWPSRKARTPACTWCAPPPSTSSRPSPACSSPCCRPSPRRSNLPRHRTAHLEQPLAPLPAGHTINAYSHLMTRIERKQIDALLEANRDSLAPAAEAKPAKAARQGPTPSSATPSTRPTPPPPKPPRPASSSPSSPSTTSARSTCASPRSSPPSTSKARQAAAPATGHRRREAPSGFAGIKSAYDPATLVGRLTVMVANLAPRKMKFGMSEGMVLAASDASGETPGLFILSPDAGAMPGMRVK
jgi:methionyl-tRNA synthetase